VLDEEEEEELVLSAVVDSGAAGVTTTGPDFSGKYKAPFRPQAVKMVVTNTSAIKRLMISSTT